MRDLVEASKEYNTLQTIIDIDVANGTVRTSGSHSRNLRRVRQGLDLIRALFEQFLSTKYVHPLSIFLFPFFFYIFFISIACFSSEMDELCCVNALCN